MVKKILKGLYPVLCGLFPFFSLFLHNYYQVEFFRAARALAVATLLAAITLLVFWLLFRKGSLTRVMAAQVILILLEGGALAGFLSEHPLWGFNLGRVGVLGPALGMFLCGMVIFLSLRKGLAEKLDRLGNWFACGLVCVLIFNVGCLMVEKARSFDRMQMPSVISAAGNETMPNIYHIVLDGYTGSKALQEDFGFDNSIFEDQLKALGFDIPELSYSNYENTAESLASELNLEMVQFFLPTNEVDANKLKLVDKMVNSRVRAFLEGKGYRTIAFENEFRWSLWKNADVYLSPRNRNFFFGPVNSFERLCLQNSIVGLLLTSYDSLFFAKQQEELGLGNLDKYEEQSYIIDELPETTAYRSPKFVFAHTTFTHVPFVFALDGSVLSTEYQGDFRDTEFNDPKIREGYIISIQYANEQILEIVKEILNKDPDAIIILQGDHGYPGENRQQIFLAVYDPKKSIEGIKCMTPVNLYRLIFNNWFGTDYSLLSNTLFKTLERNSYQYEAFATCESYLSP